MKGAVFSLGMRASRFCGRPVLAGGGTGHRVTSEATQFAVSPVSEARTISTCSVACARRRKFNLNPEGVPSWANYDGNQKCIDGESSISLR